MSSTGKSFKATGSVASLFRDILADQFPKQEFSIVLLTCQDRKGIGNYEIHIESAHCPEEIKVFIDDYLARLFPNKGKDQPRS